MTSNLSAGANFFHLVAVASSSEGDTFNQFSTVSQIEANNGNAVGIGPYNQFHHVSQPERNTNARFMQQHHELRPVPFFQRQPRFTNGLAQQNVFQGVNEQESRRIFNENTSTGILHPRQIGFIPSPAVRGESPRTDQYRYQYESFTNARQFSPSRRHFIQDPRVHPAYNNFGAFSLARIPLPFGLPPPVLPLDPIVVKAATEWIVLLAPDGRSYYYSARTGALVWDKPKALVDLDFAKTELLNSDSISEAKKQNIKKSVEQCHGHLSTTYVQGTHWFIVMTNDGHHFFFDSLSKQSVWERPLALYGRLDVDEFICDCENQLKHIPQNSWVNSICYDKNSEESIGSGPSNESGSAGSGISPISNDFGKNDGVFVEVEVSENQGNGFDVVAAPGPTNNSSVCAKIVELDEEPEGDNLSYSDDDVPVVDAEKAALVVELTTTFTSARDSLRDLKIAFNKMLKNSTKRSNKFVVTHDKNGKAVRHQVIDYAAMTHCEVMERFDPPKKPQIEQPSSSSKKFLEDFKPARRSWIELGSMNHIAGTGSLTGGAGPTVLFVLGQINAQNENNDRTSYVLDYSKKLKNKEQLVVFMEGRNCSFFDLKHYVNAEMIDNNISQSQLRQTLDKFANGRLQILFISAGSQFAVYEEYPDDSIWKNVRCVIIEDIRLCSGAEEFMMTCSIAYGSSLPRVHVITLMKKSHSGFKQVIENEMQQLGGETGKQLPNYGN